MNLENKKTRKKKNFDKLRILRPHLLLDEQENR